MPHARSLRTVLALIIAVGILGAVLSTIQAGAFLTEPSPFELAVALKSIQGLSLERGLDPAEVLERLADSGVTAAVVEERTLSDLALLGDLAVVQGPDAARAGRRFAGLDEWLAAAPGVPATLLVTADEAIAGWAAGRAAVRFGPGRVAVFRGVDSLGTGGATVVAVRGHLPSYTRLGLYPPDLEMVEHAGLRLVVRLHNPKDQPGLRLSDVLDPLRVRPGEDGSELVVTAGVVAVLFDESDVWGFGVPGGPGRAGEDLAREGLAFAVNANRLPAGIVEFGRTAGWRGIGVQEVWTTGRPELYAEGVVERQAPLLVVMPGFYQRYSQDPEWPSQVVAALESFRSGIDARGLEAGPPRPVSPDTPSLIWSFLSAAGVVAGAVLALLTVTAGDSGNGRRRERPEAPVRRGLASAALASGLLTAAALPFLLGGPGRTLAVQALGLVAALAFPVLALQPVLARWLGTEGGLRSRAWLGAALRDVVYVASVAAVGGLLVRGLGAGPEFTLKVVLFRGIKVAVLAGPAAGLVLFWLLGQDGGPRRRAVGEQAAAFLRARLTLGTVTAAAAIAVVAFYLVSRSGNEPLLPVSDLEFRVRRFLLDLLEVRPRTKEFLLGYPAIVAGAWLSLGGSRRLRAVWGYGLAALAGIVPSSVVNTFAHFHIPAVVSIERTALGLALGLPFGLIAVAVLRAVASRRGPTLRGGGRRLRVAAAVVLGGATLLAVGLLFPGPWAANPLARPLEVALDLGDVETLTGGELEGTRDALRGMAAAGVTTLALRETTPGDLEQAGLLRIVDGRDIQRRVLTGEDVEGERDVYAAEGFDPAKTYVFLGRGGDEAWRDDMTRRLLEGTAGRTVVSATAGDSLVLSTTLPVHAVAQAGLGFPERQARERLEPARGTSFLVAPRPRNAGAGVPGVSDDGPEGPGGSGDGLAALRTKLGELARVLEEMGLEWSTLVFEGQAVGGYPDAYDGVAHVLEEFGLTPGLILRQGAPGYLGQLGTQDLAGAVDYRYARVLPLQAGPSTGGDPAGGTQAGPGRAGTAQEVATRVPDLVYIRLALDGDPAAALDAARDLAGRVGAVGRPAGPATPNRTAVLLPGALLGYPWLELSVITGVLLLPLLAALLAGLADIRGHGGAVALGAAALMPGAVLLASVIDGLAVRLLLSDTRVLLELRPASVWPGLPVVAGILAALAFAPRRPAGAGDGQEPGREVTPAWWEGPATPAALLTLVGLLSVGYWLPTVGPAGVGAGLVLSSSAAALGPGRSWARVAGAAYAGTSSAYLLAATAGGSLLTALGWVAGSWLAGYAGAVAIGAARRRTGG